MADDDPLFRGDNDFAPFDVQLEQALIGWALTDGRTIPVMQTEMAVADIYDPLHRLIFERMFAKFEAELPITPLTLQSSLKNIEAWRSVGGHAYAVGCAQSCPAAASLDDLMRQVKDAARTVADLRMRRDAATAIVDTAEMLRAGETVSASLAPTVTVADTEMERIEHRRGAVQIGEAGYTLVRDLEENLEVRLPAAPTGLDVLNRIVGGNFPGELVVVGGRPGMGKSIVGQLFARHAALDDFAVDYFDLENKTGVLTARMLCDIDYDRAFAEGLQPIQFSRIRLRRLSADERGRLAEASIRLQELDLAIHDREEMTMAAIASITRAKRARTKKRMMIVIDHMHLVEPSQRYFGRKVDEVSEVTKGAKRLAKRLDAVVVLLAQLNRGVESRDDKRPTMGDFRESGSIEQDADVMYGLHRAQYYLERSKPKADASEADKGKHSTALINSANVLDIGLLKNKHGPTSDVSVYCDVGCAAIRDEKPVTGQALDLKGLF